MSFDEIVHRLPTGDQKTITGMIALFKDIDRQTEQFATDTGLRCKNGCGACCENPDIEITRAEMLPLAVHLWSEGLAEAQLQEMASTPSSKVCVFFRPHPSVHGHGRCSIYPYRPALCRLFGFASRRNKHGQRTLVTCKIIKQRQSQECGYAQEKLKDEDWPAPLVTHFSQLVADIDPVGGQKLLPIKQAIQEGIEKIGFALRF